MLHAQLRYARTKKGVITTIYGGQTASSKRRGHSPQTYSREWLNGWIMDQDLFHTLYAKWVDSGYIRDLKPSVDRLEDELPYTESNIQLMTAGQNRDKQGVQIKTGLKTSMLKPVIKLSKDGVHIEEYHSAREAARAMNAHSSGVIDCCNGKKKKGLYLGYKWKYK